MNLRQTDCPFRGCCTRFCKAQTILSVALPTELLPHVLLYLTSETPLKEINRTGHEEIVTALGAAESNRNAKFFQNFKSKIAVSAPPPYTHRCCHRALPCGAGGGDRTRTGYPHGILSPVCLLFHHTSRLAGQTGLEPAHPFGLLVI